MTQTKRTKGVTGRRAARTNLDLYVNKIIGDEPHLARVRDISEDGLFLYRLIEPQTGTTGNVGLELKLPGTDDVIWAVGEVVRHDNPAETREGVGIRFTRISAHDKALIADFVSERRQSRAIRVA